MKGSLKQQRRVAEKSCAGKHQVIYGVTAGDGFKLSNAISACIISGGGS